MLHVNSLIGFGAGASVETDEYFSSVVLLIHGDADTTDHSNSGHTVTLNGDAALSGSQSKFGSQSVYLDGTGDYMSVSDASDFDFGTGDYTIEGWFRRDGAQGSNARPWCESGGNRITWYLATGPEHHCFHNSTDLDSNTNMADATWEHLAMVRESGTMRLFVDGSQLASGSDSATIDAGGIYIGNGAGAAAGQYFKGYVNEFRVTKGVARYSSGGYTVPTAPFPNQ